MQVQDRNIETEFNQFISSHKNGRMAYLLPSHANEGTTVSYTVIDKAPEFISEYAYHRFKELETLMNNPNVDKAKLFKSAELIYGDYKQEYRHLNFFEKALFSILSFFGWRHSKQSVEEAYQRIQEKEKFISRPIQGNIAERIQNHRQAKEGYENLALSKKPYADLLKAEESQRKDELDKCKPEVRAIRMAKLKEEVTQEVYDKHLSKCIQAGYYDPAIIPYDITNLLGELKEVKEPITSTRQLNRMLKEEVSSYQKAGKLNKYQANHLQIDAIGIAKLYLRAYPNKSYRNAFFLVRDLIRLATYQEFYDKSSFNGSDHGSKHIHHNILNALSLHKRMRKDDYTEKDQFMEELVHFYHDIGYTVGLANKDFDCCKDHPFIGAKMIEENQDYFLYYLDKTSYETLHKCVLYHAIVNPDLTARDEKEGIHPGMVRATTSISDACAVTYDRKTQEFWEQPRALVALARLKTFLILYPDYKDKLGDKIVYGTWEGYNENNPWDKMAYDIFLHTVNELNKMVEEYDIPEEKKALFKQAIKQQFNAFKANVTLGQYGAVLTELNSVPNKEKKETEQPDYLPEISLAPSIIYGVLRDMFGADQANEAFKKLVAEFNGNMKDLEEGLNKITTDIDRNKPVKSAYIRTGNAFFKLLNHFEHDPRDPHMKTLQSNLQIALRDIHAIFKTQLATTSTRKKVLSELDKWYKEKKVPLATFVMEHLMPILSLPVTGGAKIQTKMLEELKVLMSSIKADNIDDKEFVRLKNSVTIILTSEEEYQFMRGKESAKSRQEMLKP